MHSRQERLVRGQPTQREQHMMAHPGGEAGAGEAAGCRDSTVVCRHAYHTGRSAKLCNHCFTWLKRMSAQHTEGRQVCEPAQQQQTVHSRAGLKTKPAGHTCELHVAPRLGPPRVWLCLAPDVLNLQMHVLQLQYLARQSRTTCKGARSFYGKERRPAQLACRLSKQLCRLQITPADRG
jgi:hypothetical protein